MTATSKAGQPSEQLQKHGGRLKQIIADLEATVVMDLQHQKERLDAALSDLDRTKPLIAFFGAFSDGKSSLLSALYHRRDVPVGPAPTTDRIALYESDGFTLADSPGLYSEDLEHDTAARDFVTRASAILYVVDSVNPLKTSHYPTLHWLIDDLGKGDRIIFAVNKMDQVADLEDESDFRDCAQIKTDVVRDTLREAVTSTISPKVVCIASNPFEKGLDYWNDRDNDYRRLSRLPELEAAIAELLDEADGCTGAEAARGTLRDLAINLLDRIDRAAVDLGKVHKVIKHEADEISRHAKELERRITRTHLDISDSMDSLRRELLIAIDACQNLKELAQLIEREIGTEDGEVLQRRRNAIIEEHMNSCREEQDRTLDAFAKASDRYTDMLETLLKGKAGQTMRAGSEAMLRYSPRQLADGILSLRDMTHIPLKFRPWGALNLGKFVSRAAAWIGPVLDSAAIIVDIYKEHRLNTQAIELKDAIGQFFKDFFSEFTQTRFAETYFPASIQIQDHLRTISNEERRQRDLILRLDNARREVLDVDRRLKTSSTIDAS